jgi:hypothetical protein
MPLESQICHKTYSSPTLNKLTAEQARLLLLGHATCGDQGAKDLLEVIYPAFQSEGNDDAPPDFEDGKFAAINPRMPGFIRSSFAVLVRAGGKLQRLVRG